MLHTFPSNTTRRVYNIKPCTANEMLSDLVHTKTLPETVVAGWRVGNYVVLLTTLHLRTVRRNMQCFSPSWRWLPGCGAIRECRVWLDDPSGGWGNHQSNVERKHRNW